MSTLNDYGGGIQVDESIGDVAYDALEAKAKKEAKELAKDGMKAAGHAAVSVLDKVTDKIEPVKQIKDKIKEKLSNNPITRFKAAVRRMKQKIKQGIKRLAREGIHAVGRLAVKGIKALGHLMAAHPVASVIIIIILLFLISSTKDKDSDGMIDNGILDESTVELEGLVFVEVSDMADNDRVVILMDDCISQQYDVMGELGAEKETMAKKMYSVFRDYGFNNASIAGILGNTDCESGIDPSAIEGIFSEYGFLGTKKAEALLSLTHYTEDVLFEKYRNNDVSFNRNDYRVINDDNREVFYCGIGLAQWTGENCYSFLKAAETIGMDWYNMEYQLGYMICDSLYRPGFFAGWVTNQFEGDPEPTEPDPDDYDTTEEYDDAVEEYEEAYEAYELSWIEAAEKSGLKYVHDYEGNTVKDEERKAASKEWYLIIKEWDDDEVDTGYVETITDMASQLGAITDILDVELGQYRCLNGNIFDNSSIANAAISFAWPTKEQSKNNNGTNLYQVVHDGIWPRDRSYKACDRCVAMAVMWSGSDDDYPTGTPNQLSYLQSSGKWELVGMSTDLSVGDLSPGDIFVRNGHTWVYTSEALIDTAYGEEATPGSDSVSASLNTRSGACGPDSSHCLGNNGKDYKGNGPYYVFRCVSPDNSTTYTHLGSGMAE